MSSLTSRIRSKQFFDSAPLFSFIGRRPLDANEFPSYRFDYCVNVCVSERANINSNS